MGILDGILGSGGLGGLVGSALGFIGQQDTNSANISIANSANALSASEAEQNRQFNAIEAQKSRDFLYNTSNSAYQRATADMRAAGLNPMLAYQQGGASSGSTSTATGSMPSVVTPQFTSPIVAAAQSAASLANVDRIQAAAEKDRAEAAKKRWETGGKTGAGENYGDKMLGVLQAQAEDLATHAGLNEATQQKVLQETQNAVKEGRLIEANTGNKEADTALIKLRTEQLTMMRPQWAAERQFWMSSAGHLAPYVEHAGNPFSSMAGMAARLGGAAGSGAYQTGASSARDIDRFTSNQGGAATGLRGRKP